MVQSVPLTSGFTGFVTDLEIDAVHPVTSVGNIKM
jgi:hypothetical protein